MRMKLCPALHSTSSANTDPEESAWTLGCEVALHGVHELTYGSVQRTAKRRGCFAKHYLSMPGMKFPQPGKSLLAETCTYYILFLKGRFLPPVGDIATA